MIINKYKRYQKGLTLNHLYPHKDKNICSCGCQKKLEGRRKRWATKECIEKVLKEFSIIKGDIKIIRKELYKIDKGICRSCKKYTNDWEADHIIPVFKGGGGCELYNFQTLCKECHKIKNINER